jgi:hypothetical protein
MDVAEETEPEIAPGCREILYRLMRDRFPRNFVLPSYTPIGWWECDLFEITEAGYFREYEIKVSRSDFLRDRHKARTEWLPDPDNPFRLKRLRSNVTKHGLLEDGSTRGPSRFWYVTPAGLISRDEVPRWAGLIEMKKGLYGGISPRETKAAPWIHRDRRPDEMETQAKIAAYYRSIRVLMSHNGSDHEDHDWVI